MAPKPVEDRAFVSVRQVKGRYPAEAGRFDSGNIEARVEELSPSTVLVRIDDSSPGHEDMWLELVLELDI